MGSSLRFRDAAVLSFLMVAGMPAAASSDPAGAPSGSIRGKVVYQSGDPVCGADVALSPRGSIAPRKTKADGAFSFEGVAPGTWQIEVRYQRTLERHEVRSEVMVAPGAISEVALTIPLSPILRVRVVGESKKQITSSLSIWYRAPGGTKGSMGGRLEPGQVYFVDSIPPTSELRIEARSEGYLPSERKCSGKVELPKEMTIVLGKPLTSDIAGLLLERGKPVANAQVQFTPFDGAGDRLTTDQDGKFMLPPCPLRRAHFRVNLGARGGVVSVIDLATAGRDAIRLEVDPDNVIAGRVIDSKGRALPRVEVAIREEFSRLSKEQQDAWVKGFPYLSSRDSCMFTDEQGSFAFGGLPVAVIRIRVPTPELGFHSHGPWFNRPLAEIQDVKKGRRDVVLRVASAPALWVLVEGEGPRASATGTLWNPKRTGSPQEAMLGLGARSRHAVLRPGEECFLGFHVPGDYRLTLWGPEFPLVVSEPFKLEPDMPPLRVSPRSGVPVRGRVVSDWALPEKLVVRIAAEVPGISYGKAEISTTASDSGAFEFPRVGPGRYELTCYAERRMGKSQIDVTEKPPPEVVLRIGD